MRRHIDFKVVLLNGTKIRRRLSAATHHHYTDKDVDQVLAAAAAQLEHDYPDRSFRLAPLAGSQFNFIEVPRPEGMPTLQELMETTDERSS